MVMGTGILEIDQMLESWQGCEDTLAQKVPKKKKTVKDPNSKRAPRNKETVLNWMHDYRVRLLPTFNSNQYLSYTTKSRSKSVGPKGIRNFISNCWSTFTQLYKTAPTLDNTFYEHIITQWRSNVVHALKVQSVENLPIKIMQGSEVPYPRTVYLYEESEDMFARDGFPGEAYQGYMTELLTKADPLQVSRLEEITNLKKQRAETLESITQQLCARGYDSYLWRGLYMCLKPVYSKPKFNDAFVVHIFTCLTEKVRTDHLQVTEELVVDSFAKSMDVKTLDENSYRLVKCKHPICGQSTVGD
jgi:hypothetical protein